MGKCSELKAYVEAAFLQANNIVIAEIHRRNADLDKNVATEINCAGTQIKVYLCKEAVSDHQA